MHAAGLCRLRTPACQLAGNLSIVHRLLPGIRVLVAQIGQPFPLIGVPDSRACCTVPIIGGQVTAVSGTGPPVSVGGALPQIIFNRGRGILTHPDRGGAAFQVDVTLVAVRLALDRELLPLVCELLPQFELFAARAVISHPMSVLRSQHKVSQDASGSLPRPGTVPRLQGRLLIGPA